tara:strand:- start:364 stop:753 length:390 start_codon:yes stop_codon:yes gene_type:complete
MKEIEQTRIYSADIATVWNIISNLSRSDWVPGVERITLKEDTRIFEMQGMGDLVERIIKCDSETKELHYSAIKTQAPINHHLAKIKLENFEGKTKFIWSTEIDPEIFSDAIEKSMIASLDQLAEVLKES